MKKSELLNELRFNVLRDATTAVGGATVGVQWSDASLLTHLDNAYLQFAVDTRCLRDGVTADICAVELVAGQAEYQLHEKVIHVLRAKTPTRHLTQQHTPAGMVSTRRGQTIGFSVDAASQTIEFCPAPDEATAGTVVTLLVARRPLKLISELDDNESPETQPEHHMALVSFAAYHLLRDHDAALAGDANNMAIVQAFASAHKKAYAEAVERCLRTLRRHVSPPVQFAGWPAWS